VPALADGISKFLLQRAKEELGLALFQKFRKELNRNDEFRVIAPNTWTNLNTIDQEIYHFKFYLESLRDGFIQDFRTLPANFSKYLIQNPQILKDPDLELVVPSLLDATQLVLDGGSVGKVLDYLGNEAAYPQKNSYLAAKAAIQTADLFYKALIPDEANATTTLVGDESKKFKLQVEGLGKLLANEEAMQMMMGLLYQFEGGRIQYNLENTSSFRQFLSTMTQPQTKQFERHLRGFVKHVDNIQSQAHQLRLATNSDNPLRYQNIYDLGNSMLGILEEGLAFKEMLTGLPSSADERKLLQVFNMLNQMHFDIRLKNYSSAILGTVGLMDLLVKEENFKFKRTLLRYGNFMAAIARSENAVEVESAIESFAMPSGTSSMKKHANFNAAIGSYVGGYYGREQLSATGIEDKNLAAVWAPVGVAASYGLGRSGSLSLFFPILDVGAVAAFRLDDELTEDLPDFKFENIVAPGVYLIYGFGAEVPVSLGVGMQYGPGLRKVTDQNLNVTESNGFRWGLHLSVDIPITNLANFPKS
jgi:hypothetical protein